MNRLCDPPCDELKAANAEIAQLRREFTARIADVDARHTAHYGELKIRIAAQLDKFISELEGLRDFVRDATAR